MAPELISSHLKDEINCLYFGELDDVDHVIFKCNKWRNERETGMNAKTGWNVSADNVIMIKLGSAALRNEKAAIEIDIIRRNIEGGVTEK